MEEGGWRREEGGGRREEGGGRREEGGGWREEEEEGGGWTPEGGGRQKTQRIFNKINTKTYSLPGYGQIELHDFDLEICTFHEIYTYSSILRIKVTKFTKNIGYLYLY